MGISQTHSVAKSCLVARAKDRRQALPRYLLFLSLHVFAAGAAKIQAKQSGLSDDSCSRTFRQSSSAVTRQLRTYDGVALQDDAPALTH